MRSLLALLLVGIVANVTALPVASAQAPTPAFLSQGYVRGVSEHKYPHLVTNEGAVSLIANPNRESATVWSAAGSAEAFGDPIPLGPAEGQPDYSSANIAVGPGGALAAVWVNQPTHTIYLRTKLPGQGWVPASVVATGAFPVYPDVAWASDGAIYVTWRNPDAPIVARRSPDQGATWGPVLTISDRSGYNRPVIASGPNGAVSIAYMQASRPLQVFVSTWNATRGTFGTSERVSALDDNYADPSASYGPDGRLYVAWRGVADSGAASGVFYSARQDNGSWPIAHLIAGRVAGAPIVHVDDQGNVHMVWTASPNGGYQVWYSALPTKGVWSTPVVAPLVGGTLFNVDATVTVADNDSLLLVAASEVFYGGSIFLRTYRFASGLTAGPRATAVFAGGAPTTAASSVPVTFDGVAGSPTHVRARWGGPPTEADRWQPFGPLTLPIPAGLDGASCTPLTLFTQVRSASGAPSAPTKVNITLDRAVQASLAMPGSGAPGFVNRPSVTLLVDARAECSGPVSARLLTSAQAISVTEPVFTLQVPISASEGVTQTVGVELRDALGTTRALTSSVVYDATPPSFTPGGPLTITPDPQASVLTTVRVPLGSYIDASGARPWALQIAVTPGSELHANTPLTWATLPLDDAAGVAGSDLAATVSLGEFVPRELLAPGSYTYVVRVLDMAGNPSATTVTGTLTLEQISFVDIRLPLVRR